MQKLRHVMASSRNIGNTKGKPRGKGNTKEKN
jgi:hypothetical protein